MPNAYRITTTATHRIELYISCRHGGKNDYEAIVLDSALYASRTKDCRSLHCHKMDDHPETVSKLSTLAEDKEHTRMKVFAQPVSCKRSTEAKSMLLSELNSLMVSTLLRQP